MSFLADCCGLRRRDDADREPLLPQYADDTTMQRQLHQKLHTYQQFRAISKGYMPNTEQIIINLRTLLSSDFFNADNTDLSASGRRLTRYTRQWLEEFIELLRHKNDRDQVQDLIWYLSKSRITLDTEHVAERARKSKARADTLAAYQSLKAIGSLAFLNDDFRTFLSDLNIVGREIFKDSAIKLSEVAEEAGKKLEPSAIDQKAITQPGADADGGAPWQQDLENDVVEVGQVLANGTSKVTRTTAESAKEKLAGDEGQVLINRLKQTVLSLRQRKDYSQSVSTLSLLLQRYAFIYSRAASEISDAANEDTHRNAELDRAAQNAWALVTSFGDRQEWDKSEALFKQVLSHQDNDPELEGMMTDVGDSLQKMLTDPSFFDDAQARFQQLRAKSQKTGKGSSISQDVEAFLKQLEVTFNSVVQDSDIHKLLQTSLRLFQVLSPSNQIANTDLLQDTVNVFVPLLINAIQYIPILRLEISNPDVDLLLENLIIEPGNTVNKSSFLPYRLKVEAYNDLDIRRTQLLQTATSMKNLMTIKLDGLSLRADEVGFWLNKTSGLLRLHDEGIFSLAMDERGIDIHIDVEICRERMEQILTLKAVRVHIHKLNFHFRRSKFAWIGFLFKPLIRPLLRKTLEKQVAMSIADLFHSANRELLFARERLRATRVANPDDLLTFFKAIAARLQPAEDPDTYTRVGIAQPGKGVFKGVYAPGSVVKVWNEEATGAGERVDEFDAGGWRNEIFDVHVANMG